MGISLQEVKFAYSAPKKRDKNPVYNLVVDELNIDKNEFICISGHTGSGKSTLVQILNCLYHPTKGTVTIDDKVVTKKTKLNPIRRKIGLVFQFPEYQLFEETVLKDVSFGPKNFGLENPEEHALNALRLLKIEDLKDENPLMLSGGQMRKVTIAGILASDPDVLILDEPTAGLDPKSKIELLDILKDLIGLGKTVIIITHDMDVVNSYGSRVVVMNSGQVVYDGIPSELFRDKRLLKDNHLSLPSLSQLLLDLNKKLGTNYNIYVKDVNEALISLGGKHE